VYQIHYSPLFTSYEMKKFCLSYETPAISSVR